jgi:hypothetical protein
VANVAEQDDEQPVRIHRLTDPLVLGSIGKGVSLDMYEGHVMLSQGLLFAAAVPGRIVAGCLQSEPAARETPKWGVVVDGLRDAGRVWPWSLSETQGRERCEAVGSARGDPTRLEVDSPLPGSCPLRCDVVECDSEACEDVDVLI